MYEYLPLPLPLLLSLLLLLLLLSYLLLLCLWQIVWIQSDKIYITILCWISSEFLINKCPPHTPSFFQKISNWPRPLLRPQLQGRATLYKFLIYANEALSHYFTFATRRPTNAVAAHCHSAPSSQLPLHLPLPIHSPIHPTKLWVFSCHAERGIYIFIYIKNAPRAARKCHSVFSI